ncbi:MAG: DUF2851 family protein [Cryomorphaceae bacterium]
MREDFLHFVWQHRLYDAVQLKTTDGVDLAIRQTGTLNLSSGPDFSEARIEMESTQWIGTVEIHLRSSDWYAHQHDADTAYDTVILHVVYEHDREVTTTQGDAIPTLELKGRIRKELLDRYGQLKNSKSTIPCAHSLHSIAPIQWKAWLDRVLTERLEAKSRDVELHLKHADGHWLQVYYSFLAGYLGGNWNKLPMFELARKLPFVTLGLYKDTPLKREALLLGTAGWIPNASGEPYVQSLEAEYHHLSNKHVIEPIAQRWKTGRVRPDNSPVHRIVQLSGVLGFLEEAFRQLIDTGSFDWSKVDLDISEYWKEYNGFELKKRNRTGRLSSTMSDLLAINVHAPLLFQYGVHTGDISLRERALEGLRTIAPESNRFIREWKTLGLSPDSAADSQAMIELTTRYCTPKKCVICNVGRTIISRA